MHGISVYNIQAKVSEWFGVLKSLAYLTNSLFFL